MESSDINKTTVRVAESDPKFVGRGIAHIDPLVIQRLNLKTGDVLEVSGNKRKTHVYCGQVNNQILEEK